MKPTAPSAHAVRSEPGASLPRLLDKRVQRAVLLTSLTFGLAAKPVLALDGWITVDELKPPVPTADPAVTGPGISGVSHDVGVFGSNVFSVGSARYDANASPPAYSAIIRKSPSSGNANTWTEVDYYAPTGWPYRKYRGFGSGADGTLYAAGDLFRPLPDNQWKSAWMVQKSINGGENWVEDEIYQENGQEWDKAACFDIKGHPNGDVYAVGGSVTTGFSWEVRKKSAGATSVFTRVDKVGPRSMATYAHAVAFNGTDILVVGRVDSGSGGLWTVRRSIDNGVTWATVDTFADGKGAWLSEAMGIAVNPRTGAIYVSGWASQPVKNRTVYNWVVRRSLNRGTTWTTVDRFGAQAGAFDTITVQARGVTVAPSDTVFVVGVTPPPRKLMVRKGTTSSTGVMTWVVSDQLVDDLVPPRESTGYGIAADASGNIYCSGLSKLAADGNGFFITRKLSVP